MKPSRTTIESASFDYIEEFAIILRFDESTKKCIAES